MREIGVTARQWSSSPKIVFNSYNLFARYEWVFYVDNLQELFNISCHIDQFWYWKGKTVCNILCRLEPCTLFDIQQCKILNKWCHNNGDVIRTDWNFLSNRKAKKMQCQSFYAQTCAYNLQVNCIHISTVNYKNVAQKIKAKF